MFNKNKPSKREIIDAQLKGDQAKVDELAKQRAEHEDAAKAAKEAHELAQKEATEELLEAYRKVSNTESGRKVLKHIRALCAIGAPILFENTDLTYSPQFSLQQCIKHNIWIQIDNFLPLAERMKLQFPQAEIKED